VVPISEHQDTVGPLARSVQDAATVLQAIAGVDPNDNYTSAIPNNGTIPDYVAACNISSLKGKRIGIPRNMITPALSSDPVSMAFAAAIKTITDLGATIVDDADITKFAQNVLKGDTLDIVLGADFVTDLPSTYLSKLTVNPNNISSLSDVEAFTKATPAEDYPDRDVAHWDAALKLGYNNTDPRFWAAYQTNLLAGGSQGILGVLQNNSLDALILPTTDAYQMPAIVGTPVITVPLGFYPSNQPVTKNFPRADLVVTGPNVP
jgi:amidase